MRPTTINLLAAFLAIGANDGPRRRCTKLRGDIDHYESPRPLTKRQRRRMKGKK